MRFFSPKINQTGSQTPQPPYLHNIDAWVKVDGSFGFLAVLFVLVGVEDVRAIGELRQIEVPPFEDLQYTAVDDKSVVADWRGMQNLMTGSKNHDGQNGETFPFAALAANMVRGDRKWCHVSHSFATSPLLRFYGYWMTSTWMTHPHGDGQAAVDVSFLKPALLHDASSLWAQRCWVLTGRMKSHKLRNLGLNQVASSALQCWLHEKKKISWRWNNRSV